MIREWIKGALKERLGVAEHEKALRKAQDETKRYLRELGNLRLDLENTQAENARLRNANESQLQMLEGMSKNLVDRARVAHNVRIIAATLVDDSEQAKVFAVLDGADPEKL